MLDVLIYYMRFTATGMLIANRIHIFNFCSWEIAASSFAAASRQSSQRMRAVENRCGMEAGDISTVVTETAVNVGAVAGLI